MPTTQCPQCGRPVDTATDFCGNCGYYVGWDKTMAAANPPTQQQRPAPPKEPVVPELPPQEPQQQRPRIAPGPPPPPPTGPTIVCRNCGDINPDTRTYCQRCGERLPEAGAFVPPVQEYPPAPPYQRQLNPKVLLAVLLAVVLIIIGVIFATTRGGSNPPPQGNGNTTPATLTTSSQSTETTTPPANPTKIDPATISAEASSELPPQPQRGLSYGIGNTLDGDLNTAWNSNGEDVGTGAGQVLRYRFAEKVNLRQIDIVNGYVKSDKSFRENGRIKAVAITTDAGTFEVMLADSKEPQSLQQDFGVTDSVSLRVISVYKGSQYADLGLTEISFLATPAG